MNPHNKLLATIITVIALNVFVNHTVGSFAVSAILTFISVFLLYTHRPTRPPVSIILLGSILFFAAGNVMRSSAAISLISFLGIVAVNVVVISCHAFPDGFFRHASEVVIAPFRLFVSSIKGALDGWSYILRKRDNSGGIVKSTFVGLLIGLPIALILMGFLAQADPIFARFTNSMLSGALFDKLMTHVFISAFAFIALLPLAFTVVSRPVFSLSTTIKSLRFSREMAIVLTLICMVMAAFLWVQWPYIFVRVAAETDLSSFGVATYSEYVKRGFNEFIFISILLYVFSWAGLLSTRGSVKASMLTKMMQLLLLTEAGIFILSIFRRLALYVQFHGLTSGRVYGSFVLIGVAWLFIALIGRLFSQKVRWVVVEMAGLLVLCVVIIFVNTEHIIATQYPPTVNHAVDYVYLSRLSSDGYAGWKSAYAAILPVYDEASHSAAIITKDQRTKIYYSGIILSQLVRRYHRLILTHGSSVEIEEYVASVLTAQQRAISSLLPDIIRRSSDEKKSGMEHGQNTERYASLLSDLAWIEKAQSGKAHPDTLLPRISVASVPYELYNPIDTLVPTMYAINTQADAPFRNSNFWDRLYTWNYSGMKAYQKMKNEIPLPILILLQREYFALRQSISRQPTTEQDVHSDAAFDGPFLSPLY